MFETWNFWMFLPLIFCHLCHEFWVNYPKTLSDFALKSSFLNAVNLWIKFWSFGNKLMFESALSEFAKNLWSSAEFCEIVQNFFMTFPKHFDDFNPWYECLTWCAFFIVEKWTLWWKNEFEETLKIEEKAMGVEFDERWNLELLEISICNIIME